jgi:hypothetical protein
MLDGFQGRAGRVWDISPPAGFDPRTVQPVASRYTDWDISAHRFGEYGNQSPSFRKKGVSYAANRMWEAEGQPVSQNTQTTRMINKETIHKATFCNTKFRLLGGLFAKFRRKKNYLTGLEIWLAVHRSIIPLLIPTLYTIFI